eukprot:5393532-Prymnesium_polylepis.1
MAMLKARASAGELLPGQHWDYYLAALDEFKEEWQGDHTSFARDQSGAGGAPKERHGLAAGPEPPGSAPAFPGSARLYGWCYRYITTTTVL